MYAWKISQNAIIENQLICETSLSSWIILGQMKEGFGVICKINYSKTIRKEKENEYYKNQESIFS